MKPRLHEGENVKRVNEDETKEERNHVTTNQQKASARIKLLSALRSISRLKQDLSWNAGDLRASKKV